MKIKSNGWEQLFSFKIQGDKFPLYNLVHGKELNFIFLNLKTVCRNLKRSVETNTSEKLKKEVMKLSKNNWNRK